MNLAPEDTELSPELGEYQGQLQAMVDEARSLTRGLSDEQLAWRPAPHSWSVSECLAHLTLVAKIYIETIDRTIDRAHKRHLKGAGPYRHPRFGQWFVGFVDAPPRRRVKAPRLFAPPAGSAPGREAIEEFLTTHNRLLQRIPRAKGIDLGRARTRSPVTPLLRLSLGQCFAMVAAHARRHLWQARRVTEAESFPR